MNTLTIPNGTVCIIIILLSNYSNAFGQVKVNELDVVHYDLTIAPNIDSGSIKGTVTIRFVISPKASSVELHSGDLQIDGVTGISVFSFKKNNKLLTVQLSSRTNVENEISISYHGKPRTGLLFNAALGEAYTVYSTSHWMPCHEVPGDRASLDLNILIPKGKICIASGELMNTLDQGEYKLYQWHQQYETPPYTYGFAVGDFTATIEKQSNVQLSYYSHSHSVAQLSKVFRETPNILIFFEQKSGVKYIQNAYSQILIGDYYQEMSGLSVLKDSYASAVLKDSSEIHLTAHEFAHQWWGNMITCKTFQHFWLNEAFATYMSTAFNELAFGKKKYDADIALYKGIYEDLIRENKDKPLVFQNWEPSRDNRNVIYYKGAYVLHLLRLELGDDSFWKGIKSYSQKYFGKSVETVDFQRSMETSSGKKLDAFFNKWVYLKMGKK